MHFPADLQQFAQEHGIPFQIPAAAAAIHQHFSTFYTLQTRHRAHSTHKKPVGRPPGLMNLTNEGQHLSRYIQKRLRLNLAIWILHKGNQLVCSHKHRWHPKLGWQWTAIPAQKQQTSPTQFVAPHKMHLTKQNRLDRWPIQISG